MDNNKHIFELRIIKLLNMLLITLPFALAWLLHYKNGIISQYDGLQNWLIIGLFVLLYVIFARVYDAFLVSLYRISEMVYSQSLAFLFSDVILFIVIWILTGSFPSVIPILLALITQLGISVGWSIFAHKWYYYVFPPKKSAIIYDRNRDIKKLIKEYGLSKKFDILFVMGVDECIKDLSVLKNIDTIFICGTKSHERNNILKYCVSHNIVAYVLPRIGDIIMSGAMKMHMFHLPMLRVETLSARPEYTIIKRLFDIIVSASILVVASPVMLITAIAIKISDGGPILYKQDRLTKDGKVFKILKFRSMRTDAEKDGIARLSTGEHDDRITPIGKIIRKLRTDEIPQLFNVLIGSMSIVGPRPERPEIAKQYEEELPEFALRLQCKAGLTGYAQVYGKYNTTPYDKLQMDLMYIARPSLLEDLRILFATVKIIFIPESTDGIEQGQTTASSSSKESRKELATATKGDTVATQDNFDI